MRKKDIKEVTLFFVITMLSSYFVFWGPIALFKVPAVNPVNGVRGPLWAIILFIIGGFTPSITGLILTAVFDGKKGVWDLIKQAFQLKIRVKWIAAIIIIFLYFAFSMTSLFAIIGGKFKYSQFLIQLPSIIPLFILGPLSEEYGWRGFALQRLLKHLDANTASLVTGLVWAFWHLPLFYIMGTTQHEFHLPFLTFAISVISISFVFTYAYKQTNKSLFTAVFLHWGYTYVTTVVASSITRSFLYNWLEFIPALLIGFVFAIALNKKRLSSVSGVSTPAN